jgi:hypothetical protein
MDQDNNLINTGAINYGTNQANENALGNTLQQEGQGGGAVNQATQAALTNATNQVNQQQMGSIASTKGINPALAAYLGSQQAGANQQAAANNAASLTAQNSMAAQNAQASLLGQQGSQDLNLSQIGQSGLSSANTANAGIANTNAQGSNSLTAGALSSVGSALGLADGGQVPSSSGPMGMVKQLAPLAMLALANGGGVPRTAQNNAPDPSNSPLAANPAGPKSKIGQALAIGNATGASGMASAANQAGQSLGNGIFSALGKLFSSGSSDPNNPYAGDSNVDYTDASPQPLPGLAGGAPLSGGAPTTPGLMGGAPLQDNQIAAAPTPDAPSMSAADAMPGLAKGGKVPALVSPGEGYLTPDKVKEVAQSKDKGHAALDKAEKIPGKPKVGGAKNSYANDTVPKTLEAGGIVLPRSVTQAKDPAAEAAKFVSAYIAKGKNKGMLSKKSGK